MSLLIYAYNHKRKEQNVDYFHLPFINRIDRLPIATKKEKRIILLFIKYLQ